MEVYIAITSRYVCFDVMQPFTAAEKRKRSAAKECNSEGASPSSSSGGAAEKKRARPGGVDELSHSTELLGFSLHHSTALMPEQQIQTSGLRDAIKKPTTAVSPSERLELAKKAATATDGTALHAAALEQSAAAESVADPAVLAQTGRGDNLGGSEFGADAEKGAAAGKAAQGVESPPQPAENSVSLRLDSDAGKSTAVASAGLGSDLPKGSDNDADSSADPGDAEKAVGKDHAQPARMPAVNESNTAPGGTVSEEAASGSVMGSGDVGKETDGGPRGNVGFGVPASSSASSQRSESAGDVGKDGSPEEGGPGHAANADASSGGSNHSEVDAPVAALEARLPWKENSSSSSDDSESDDEDYDEVSDLPGLLEAAPNCMGYLVCRG